MSNKRAAILPSLLEQVFEKYSNANIKDNLGDFFVELDTLLSSRVVKNALQLLDYCNITIYHNQSKTKQIAEINETSSKIVRLFTHVNYCSCKFFQEQVLGSLCLNVSPYVCEHILALRLAQLLKSDKLRFEELPFSKLKILFSIFLPENENSSD